MVEIEERCARLVRQLRRKKGLTLRQCEEQSGGKFKAVVMGSYERGTRAISLERLQEIADFYEVPIQYFFNESGAKSAHEGLVLTFDLRKIKLSTFKDEAMEAVENLLGHFLRLRNDWNGEVLSIRQSDGHLLPTISRDPEIIEKMRFHGYFFNEKN
jgi:transcriptional regulator with XRE-family HTH domain